MMQTFSGEDAVHFAVSNNYISRSCPLCCNMPKRPTPSSSSFYSHYLFDFLLLLASTQFDGTRCELPTFVTQDLADNHASNQKELIDCGAANVLCDAMRRFSDDEELHGRAAGAVCNLTAFQKQAQNDFGERGAVSLVVRALNMYGPNSPVVVRLQNMRSTSTLDVFSFGPHFCCESAI